MPVLISFESVRLRPFTETSLTIRGIRVGTFDKGDFVNVVGLVDLGAVKDLLNGLESGAKEVLDTVRVRVEGGRRYCLVRQFHVGHSMT